MAMPPSESPFTHRGIGRPQHEVGHNVLRGLDHVSAVGRLAAADSAAWSNGVTSCPAITSPTNIRRRGQQRSIDRARITLIQARCTRDRSGISGSLGLTGHPPRSVDVGVAQLSRLHPQSVGGQGLLQVLQIVLAQRPVVHQDARAGAQRRARAPQPWRPVLLRPFRCRRQTWTDHSRFAGTGRAEPCSAARLAPSVGTGRFSAAVVSTGAACSGA